jgi:hypothetical protein
MASRVAVYAITENGDKSSLILARNVCKQNGWVQPLEYVDTSKVATYDWKNLLADIAMGDYIGILVTFYFSEELEAYCQQFGCKVIRAE